MRRILPLITLISLAAPVHSAPDPAVRLTALNAVSDPTWSPDAATIAFGFEDDIWTVSATGGAPVRLTSDTEFDYDPDWSPDGTQIAFFRDQDIWVVDPVTGIESALVTGPAWQQWPTWSPNGTHIAYSVSDGSTDWELVIRNLTTGVVTPMVAIAGQDVIYPSWSPDGRYIAFEARDQGGQVDIGIVDVSSGDVRPLIDLPTTDSRPSWAPSGGYIVFESERDAISVTDSDIWIAPMYDGVAGTATPISCSDEFDSAAVWSPLGDRVAFVSQRGLLGGQFDLYVLGPDVVDVSTSGSVPTTTVLTAAPNPFRGRTAIRWSETIPSNAGAVRILGPTGRLVRELAARPGEHHVEWDGLGNTGRAVPPGVYFVDAAGLTTRLVYLR